MSRTAAIQAAFAPAHAEKLNAFLRQARQAVATSASVQVVMGNEACDADSMVSSLVHAFTASAVPVMSVDRDQFALRCEVSALFRAAHIDVDALLFQDEIDLAGLHAAQKLRLVLTDHNKLKAALAPLDASVVAIMDHHDDLGAHGHVTGSSRDIAFERTDAGGRALVGSACTLVAERSLSLEPLEATLLLGVIALDTMNMDAAAKKGTARDQAVLDKLDALSLVPRHDLYVWLVEEKFSPDNWSRFTFANCLAYDYKRFESSGVSYGSSAILVPLPTFWAKGESPLAQLEAHRARLGLTFALVQSMVHAVDGPKRQLLLYCPDRRLRDDLVAFLNRAPLQLTPLDALGEPAVDAFDQANIAMSRKQLVPLLDGYLATLPKM
ncbi:hypothetical protein SPRG_12988 [Saprolegnia parasitica CBS 223.65]|uniref:DHHA2 domain-containing protein n=1 Tax=Saprolegnia parasitica (strain CBS 223.65) TaxID=695850 RepID=A0A067C251_SAPPC|nr:hypothetical protein SPRG_12988 [Saprolegnia parasitica CBS 223.65]KDO20631.1 hypothetical protein SPRG_12988 [Saprolegnia parasitica CBS 223.65]|eukprot:XP_012208685.1 hypothetical protein SPRG_12988 [Saprolegnia parasitica CBS 223.65]